MAELFADALKFGGAVMIRRIVGIAHIDDFKDIQDEVVRYAVTTLSQHCSPQDCISRYHSTFGTAHGLCVMQKLKWCGLAPALCLVQIVKVLARFHMVMSRWYQYGAAWQCALLLVLSIQCCVSEGISIVQDCLASLWSW